MRIPVEFMQDQIEVPDHQFPVHLHHRPPPPAPLPFNDLLQIKALELGEADQALRELEQLPHNTWNNPSSIKIQVAARGMLRERGEAL
jgi:hypothetical protein